MIKIEKKIVGYAVNKPAEEEQVAAAFALEIGLGNLLFFRRLVDGVAYNLLLDLDHLKLSVIAFFERIEQVRGGVYLTIVFDLFVAL